MKQAIYREFRPKDFTKVKGQNHIVEILKNQIKNENVGHAYLFSGIRGTGKTTCAKIFARAVNCLNPIDGSPCNECENCKMILDDRCFEVVEMDAASNRRIDDIREIKEKVIYPPQLVKYKVYIIDEAHMITNEGFNALLKILEEPPKHLIFILATTEIEKLPDTIISRCQRFDFKRIDSKNIVDNIKFILDDLHIDMEIDAINLISEISSGAMRDALSILDSVITFGKNKITLEDVNNSLGLVNLDSLFSFSDAIASNFSNRAVEIYRNLVDCGKSPFNILTDFVKHFRNIMLVKTLSKNLTNLNDIQYKRYKDIENKFSLDKLIYILDNLLDGLDSLKKSDMQNAISEVLIIKMCSFLKKESDLEKRVLALENIIKNKNVTFNDDFIAKDVVSNDENLFDVEIIKKDDDIEGIKEDFYIKDDFNDYEISTCNEQKEENTECTEKINLFSVKDVVKDTIFKKTIKKLFDESVKDLVYYKNENFLEICCKEYLFKFSSYKLDEHNSFECFDSTILDEFFSKINVDKKPSLKIFANFVED